MSINAASYTRFARVSSVQAAPSREPFSAPPNNGSRDLLTARRELSALYDAVQRLGELLGIATPGYLERPDAVSQSPLGLDLAATAASFTSAEEINALPASFTPFGPDWSGGSTALLTLGGAYDGSNGSGDLQFEVRRAGIRGLSNIRLRVYDPGGNTLASIRVRANDPPDTRYMLPNGLFVTMGNGFALQNDTATASINATTGSAFDPGLPFDGIRNDNPNFHYYDAPDTLAPVANGSFTLNGESITVDSGDTLDALVTRINHSAAGVSAAYDAAAERLRFTQQTAGAAHSITLANDTSNLLAALKLDTGVLTPGTDPEPDRALADVALFGSVQSGAVRINGTDIAVDTGSDSLEDVLARINDAGIGVSAAFHRDAQTVTITGPGDVLEIDDNGTGLIAALQLPAGRLDADARPGGISRRRAYAIADEIEGAFASLNRLFDNSAFRDGGDHTGIFRNALAAAFGAELDGRYGVGFDDSAEARRRGRFAEFDRAGFTRALGRRGTDVKRLLAGSGDAEGFVARLGDATLAALRNVGAVLGRRGVFVDTSA